MADIVKKIGAKSSTGSEMIVKDIGSEAQNVNISYDNNGNIIEDINEPGIIIKSTKSAAKAIKDINVALNNKVNKTELNKKVDLENGKVKDSLLPSSIKDVVEGFYFENKFYKESSHITEINGEDNKIYIDKNKNDLYFWENNQFIKTLGEDKSLAGLANVDVNTDLRDGDSLVYDSSKNKWVNKIITNHIVQVPTMVTETLVYNGQLQHPTMNITDPDFNKYVEIEGTFSAIDAGTYNFQYKLRNTIISCWDDQTTEPKPFTYTINKAESVIELDKNVVVLTPSKTSDTVTILNSTGNVTLSLSPMGVVRAELSNNTLTVSSLGNNGLANIVLSIPASKNYEATEKTISVDVTDIPLVSWDVATDAQITAMVNGYYEGDLSLEAIKSVWAVGQERNVSLSAMAGGDITNTEVSGVSNTLTAEAHREQTIKMVILDFDHDTLTTAQGGKTKALITIGQKDCLRDAIVTDEQGSSNTEHGKMNNSNTNLGGWKGCPRRTWCNNNYYNALPSYLKTLVKTVNKLSSEGNKSTNIITTQDKCWLASEIEIFGIKSYSVNGEGTQYPYYATASNRYKLPKWNSSYVSDFWWERSPLARYAIYFCRVSHGGSAANDYASSANGIAPSCCL